MNLSSDLKVISDMASRLSSIAHTEAGRPTMSYSLFRGLLRFLVELKSIDKQLNVLICEMDEESTASSGEDLSNSDFGRLQALHDLVKIDNSFDLRPFRGLL